MIESAAKMGKGAAKAYLAPASTVVGSLSALADAERWGDVTGRLGDVDLRSAASRIGEAVTSRVGELPQLPTLPDLEELKDRTSLKQAPAGLMTRIRRMALPLGVAAMVFTAVMIARSMRSKPTPVPYAAPSNNGSHHDGTGSANRSEVRTT